MKSGRAALLILLAVGVLVLGGCIVPPIHPAWFEGGSVKVTPGREGYLIIGAPLFGNPEIYSAGTDIRVPRVIFTGCLPSDTWTCVPIQVTENSSDEEFWQFEARLKLGLSGRIPADSLIVGSERQCEEIRTLVSEKGTPTERCQGPWYFKRTTPSAPQRWR